MDTLSEKLIGLNHRSMEDRDLSRAPLHLLDWLGTVLAARNSAAALALSGGPTGLDTAFGVTGTPEAAAFQLGALGNLLEMDDLHRASILHAGDTVWASALALATRRNIDGATLLRAGLAGYETALRIGRAAARGGYSNWYNSGTCGVYGAAAASARILALSLPQTADALGHAGMQAAGLWQCRLEGGEGKQLAMAHAARAGVTSACVAHAGARGPREILEGRLGFFETFYPAADPDEVLENPDSEWLLHDVSFKPWPACRHTHPAIAAALSLRNTGLSASTISDVKIITYDAALTFCNNAAPNTAHEARFSLQTAVAIALCKGAPRIADFEDPTRRDATDVAHLRQRITLVSDPAMTAAFPDRYAARVEVQTMAGKTLSADAPHAPGDPEAPLSEADLCAKFLNNAAYARIARPAAQTLITAILELPEAKDLTDLRGALSRLSSPLSQLRSSA
ncbi:MmgE/PrpD family protein [Tropicimonas sp. S265A]|uniref:MmgE/PrpD family protein n=1 Tax=Tropicimonas sp. S265A TaxID=3415134 RepID=UPI003C7B1475